MLSQGGRPILHPTREPWTGEWDMVIYTVPERDRLRGLSRDPLGPMILTVLLAIMGSWKAGARSLVIRNSW